MQQITKNIGNITNYRIWNEFLSRIRKPKPSKIDLISKYISIDLKCQLLPLGLSSKIEQSVYNHRKKPSKLKKNYY